MIKNSFMVRNIELNNIWLNLRSKNVQVQEEASTKLFEYLQKHSEETDDIFERFKEQLETNKTEQKFGIFIALNKILHISRETQIVHYVNQLIPVLLDQLRTNNYDLVEKGAECLGNLAEAGGSITAEVIDKSLNYAIQWLQDDTNPKSTDIKKYSAVLILREFCCKQAVITFNKLFGIEQNYALVFAAFKDNREKVRTTAAEVIKQCIHQISERQKNKGPVTHTQLIYQQVEQAFQGNDSNFQQAALSVLGALISQRATSQEIITNDMKGKMIVDSVMRLLQSTKNILVKQKCVELIPIMYENIKHVFKHEQLLELAIQKILEQISSPKSVDRGPGFIAIGKMILIVDRDVFNKYVGKILDFILHEIRPPPIKTNGLIAPIANLDSLTCLKSLLKRYADFLIQHKRVNMLEIINSIFYTGYNRQVIECLGEISIICNGRYKRAAQVKLLNSCYIILQMQKDPFPLNLEEQFLFTNADVMINELKATLLGIPPPQQNPMAGSLTARGKVENAGSKTQRGEKNPLLESQKTNDKRAKDTNGLADGDQSFSQATDYELRVQALNKMKSKRLLKEFYSQVLDENNQNFLYQLVKQSHILYKDEKSKDSNQGATERTQMVTLALRTLQMFDFQALAMSTVYFIENSVLNFLDDENPNVRKEAMRTCCGLALPKTNHLKISSTMERIINKLLHRFFVTATTDNEERIRVTMLKHLNPQFDPFISKYENLLMLFNCMQDTTFEIKEKTVRILGRLVPHNASQILPYLRQLIVALISQIEQSNDAKEREEAVRLINMFVKSAPEIARSYSTSILSCLIKKLEGDRATFVFVSSTLNVISEIAKVNSLAIKPYLSDLFPLCLMCIKDQSSAIKRQMAIHTLISIIVNTNFVVKPYFYFPELLGTITDLVATEQNFKIRKLILKLIGTLGAVDPYLMKQIKNKVNAADLGEHAEIQLPVILEQDENDDGMKKIRYESSRIALENSSKQREQDKKQAIQKTQKLLVHYDELNLSKDHKYPAMAIHHLLKVLVNPNLRDHHKVCLAGIRYIVKNQPDCMPFMPMLIPPLMELFKQNDLNLSESLFSVLKKIILYIPQAMYTFADPIFAMIHEVIHIQPILVMDLLHEIMQSYKACLFSHIYLVLPEILQLIEQSGKKAEQAAAAITTDAFINLVTVTKKAINLLPLFDTQILDDHLYLIVPLLLRTTHRRVLADYANSLNIFAIKTLIEMIKCPTFREHLAQVVHQQLRLLDIHNNEMNLVDEIMKSFCEIAVNLNSDFAPYTSLIQKAIRRNKLQERFAIFDLSIKQITKNDPIVQFRQNLEKAEEAALHSEQLEAGIIASREREARVEQKMNTEELLREFDTSKCSISDDWRRWLLKTSHQLLKQNPSPVLFACSTLTEVYAPLAQDLYCIAFVSCWRQMSEFQRATITECLRNAINSPSRTNQVLQQILNLAEFMELDENEDVKLFSSQTLAKIAEECNAYAKALYYWEQEFENNPKDTVELLIQTNYLLQQPEAAEGILEYAQKNLLIVEKEDWYEKLQKWPDALAKYEEKPITRENYVQVQRGKLACYRNLMDWKELSKLVESMWDKYLRENEPEQKDQIKKVVREAAPDAVYAAWNLGHWHDMKEYAPNLDSKMHLYEKNFYSAVYLIKVDEFERAFLKIDEARDIINTKITSLLGESYNRAYSLIQELQFLKELEEVIEYKRTNSQEKRQNFYQCWVQRQKAVPPHDLEIHQKLLNIRCLVKDKQEEIESFINFAKMAQDTGNSRLSKKILKHLKKDLWRAQDNLIKEEKKQGNKSVFTIKEKYKKLINNLARVEIAISDALYNRGGSQGDQNSFQKAKNVLKNLLKEPQDIEPQLLSICHQKLGSWQFEYMESNKQTLLYTDDDYQEIVNHCYQATQINPKNTEAWNIFSTTNDEASIHYSKKFSFEYTSTQLTNIAKGEEKKTRQKYLLHRDFGHKILPLMLQKSQRNPRAVGNQKQHLLAKKYVEHVVSAMTGLVQQLCLSSKSHTESSTKTLQTTLRLLKIWFQHGNLPEIDQKLRQGFERIDLKVWIEVIPQLLARIDMKDQMIRQTLINLIEKISMKFPQSLIYSLSVTQESSTQDRREAAESLLEKLRATQPILIEQATTISKELNRSAILLSETWQEAIEEASRIYFGRNDGLAMYHYIMPHHEKMNKEPETMNEVAFFQGYASELLDAKAWMERFILTEDTADINQAWDIYYSIFKKISSKQKEVQFYELRNVAPKLLTSENLDIAVPGSFKSNKNIVKISKFASVLPVLSSKQHPRKMALFGSDGREYLFLLKGHEDIRQDERVMQLFGLVNTLLSIDPQTSKKDLSIRRYPVIPLSQNTGLIGWVNQTDTLHVLIKEHREENKIIHNIDYKLMDNFCQHFEICPLPNKVEIFKHALEKTLGEDLKVVLWVKSQNSEVWLERRTNYTRSLAVMSMVGYILGLGDRHPSNIMLERYTGRIVHIDFGDCFEIAMRREKFPERIPFRLTRMLVRAMEVSGIEGNFRKTCENTLRVMRESKDSLLAIMEAFVYDPLISFRLLNPQMFNKKQKDKKEEQKEEVGKKGMKDVDTLKKLGGQESNNGDIKSLPSLDVVAEIEKANQNQIHEKIMDDVLIRLQRGNTSAADKNLAESKFSRYMEDMELQQIMKEQDQDQRQNELNQIAEIVFQRIQDKLRGLEFQHQNKTNQEQEVDGQSQINNPAGAKPSRSGAHQKNVNEQVDILIKQATSYENLASCYVGWCPYW